MRLKLLRISMIFLRWLVGRKLIEVLRLNGLGYGKLLKDRDVIRGVGL